MLRNEASALYVYDSYPADPSCFRMTEIVFHSVCYAHALCCIFYTFPMENPVVYFTFFSILSNMQILSITTSHLDITEDTTIIDRGTLDSCNISVSGNVHVRYVFIGDTDKNYTREFHLAHGVHFEGGAVIYANDISYHATTYIEGDNVTSNLMILGLARSLAKLDIRGSSVVDHPYRHIVTRIDQNNIFLGEGGSIRGMPILEIATDDIE